MFSTVRTMILGLAVGLCPSSAQAQVVASQGSKGAELTEFASPMILELPFEDVSQIAEGATFRLKGVGNYVCEDAMLTRLVAKKTRASVKRGDTYSFEGVVVVRPSHDRRVILYFEILVGGVSVSTEGRVALNVEESNSGVFAAEVKLTPEQTAQLAADPAASKLKLKVAVVED